MTFKTKHQQFKYFLVGKVQHQLFAFFFFLIYFIYLFIFFSKIKDAQMTERWLALMPARPKLSSNVFVYRLVLRLLSFT